MEDKCLGHTQLQKGPLIVTKDRNLDFIPNEIIEGTVYKRSDGTKYIVPDSGDSIVEIS